MTATTRTNKERAMETVALFVEEIQKNDEFDQNLLYAAEKFVEKNSAAFHSIDENEQRAMELISLFLKEIQVPREFDRSLLHSAKEFLKNNCVAFYDEDDNDEDTEDFEEGFDGEWDHIDGYSSRFIVMNSSPDIEWTASDFD
jgi:hypothetical protein